MRTLQDFEGLVSLVFCLIYLFFESFANGAGAGLSSYSAYLRALYARVGTSSWAYLRIMVLYSYRA